MGMLLAWTPKLAFNIFRLPVTRIVASALPPKCHIWDARFESIS